MIEHIITSTVLILFILIISAVLENRINPCIKYALWLLVAVKLLLPLSAFENNINIMNLVRQTENANVQYIFVDNATERNTGRTDNISDIVAKEEVTADNAILPATKSAINLSTILKYIWICGMAFCAGAFLWSNIRFHIRLNQKRQLAGKYKNRIPIYEADGIGMPCLFGVFRPAIYLEKDYGLSEQQRGYILEHEYTHFRHGDHIWAVVRCLCVILYWYNPFVWLAAHKSIADSELACDAGTLKQLAETEHLSYGRTLIEMAENISKKKYSMRILKCSTSAAGGMREMKKRIKMIAKRPHTKIITLVVVLILCCGIVGFTFGRSVGETPADLSENEVGTTGMDQSGDVADIEENDLDTVELRYNNEEIQKEARRQAEVQAQQAAYEQIHLYSEPKPDKVCISVTPSGIREYLDYYYIPEGEEQQNLTSLMKDMEERWKKQGGGKPVGSRPWEGRKNVGWYVYYNNVGYRAYEDGYLYATYEDENQLMELELWLHEKEICDFIQQMLSENLDYKPIDITTIKDIVSAKLDICSITTNWEYYSQTITDKETLKVFADWFRNAKYELGGFDCGAADSCLELTLANEEVIKMSLATDSCPGFVVNGVWYDYRPTSDWQNPEFYKYFDEIPWDFH